MSAFFEALRNMLDVASSFFNHIFQLVQVFWQDTAILYTGISLNAFPVFLTASIAIVIFCGLIKFVLGR